jgi:hypothetical protein
VILASTSLGPLIVFIAAIVGVALLGSLAQSYLDAVRAGNPRTIARLRRLRVLRAAQELAELLHRID